MGGNLQRIILSTKTGTVDPTAVTPDFIGQLYINTTTDTSFFAKSTTTGDYEEILNNLLTAKGQLITHNGTNPVILSPPPDGQILVGDSSQSTGYSFDERASGIGLTFEYKADTSNQTAPPGSKKIKWDNTTQSSATKLFVDNTTDGGADIHNILVNVFKVNERIILLDRTNSSQFQVFRIDAITDQTTYVEYDVTLLESNGGDFDNNEKIFLMWFGDSTGHSQNTDTILTTDGVNALINAGVLKTNLLSDTGINIQIDQIRARDGNGLLLTDDSGNQGIKIADNGNVGIGVSGLPVAKFQINGDLYIGSGSLPATTANTLNNFTNFLGLLIKPAGAGTGDRLEIQDETGSTEFIVKDSGFIGIGTSNPNAELDVRGTPGTVVGGFASGNLHVTSKSANVNANAVITGHNLNGGNKQLWYLGSASSSDDNVTFINRQNAGLFLGTNNISRLTILANGNIGIGITLPLDQLHVVGNVRLSGNLTDGTDSFTPAELRTHLDNLTTDRKHVTDIQQDGLDNATTPSTTNPFITEDDYDPDNDGIVDKALAVTDGASGGGNLATGAELIAHLIDIGNPHIVTFSQAVTADPATDITTAEAEQLTDGSIVDDLHKHFSTIQISFESDKVNAKSNVYEVISSFAFSGTNNVPAIANRTIKVVINVDGETGAIRIFDSTNANTIAEATGITNLTPAILDIGTLSNLPTEESLFEVQMLNDDINVKKKTFIQSMQILTNE